MDAPGSANQSFLQRTLAPLTWGLLTAAAIFLALIPADVEAQFLLAGVMVGLIWALADVASESPNDWRRAAVLVFAIFLSMRYMVWRVLYTLSSADPFSFIFSWALFAAEIYAFIISALGIFVNFYPLRRPTVVMGVVDNPPSVDIYVPTYNEPAELLEVTLRCCNGIRYPEGKKKIFLLDDGGTDQKCNDPDRKKRAEAIARRAELQALCKKLGCTYLTREKNNHAKAGNLNAAMQKTSGDLILILDADHVPTADILERTVPWMIKDPTTFLVQTPHFLVNPDPIDRNLLSAFRRMPAENEMFYCTIQRGLDFWDSSFFCGSAAVLRRKHLDMVGGLTGESITEDAETALDLHKLGFRSVYVDQPMVGGLAPESFTGFVVQRMRWAQGMTQIMMLKLPSALPKMRWFQALSYINSCLFWFFPFARLIFMLSPCAYLFFGLEIYNANFNQIIAYAIPHIIATQVSNSLLFGRTRWPLISELYEVMQSIYSMMALFQVFRNPRKPQFVVTPKSEIVEEEFISPLVKPFYVLLAILGLSFIAGVIRWELYAQSRDLTTVVLIWNILNFCLVAAAFGALLERRQRRGAPRMPATTHGSLEAPDGKVYRCNIDDISVGGFRVVFDTPPASRLTFGDQAFLRVWVASKSIEALFKVEVRALFKMGPKTALGVSFAGTEPVDQDLMYALMYGDSENWSYFVARRTRPMPFLSALGLIFRLSGRPIAAHVAIVFNKIKSRFSSSLSQS